MSAYQNDQHLDDRRREWTIFVLVCCANLVPVWFFRFFAGQDTPNHLYGAEVLRVLASRSAPAGLAAVFAPTWAVKSNVLFQGTIAALGHGGIPLRIAHKLFLSAYAIGLPAAARYCLGAANRQARALALLFLPLVWNWFAVQGLYNYVASLVPGLVWLGIVARDGGRPRLPAGLALTLASVAVFLAHSVTFAALLFVSVVRVLRPGDGTSVPFSMRMRGALPLGLALLPSITLSGLTVGSSLSLSAAVEPTLSRLEMYSFPEGVGAFFVEFAMRYHVWDLIGLGPPLLMMIAIPLLAWWQVRRPGHHERGITATARPAASGPSWPLVSAGALTILYLALPHIIGGSDLSPRLRPIIVFCLLCYTGITLSRRSRRRVAAVALVCGVFSAATLSTDFARIGHDLEDFTSGIPWVAEGSRVYPMIFDPRGASQLVRPLLHAWGYYGVDRHVVTPFAFAWHQTRFAYRYRELPLHKEGSAFPSDSDDEPYALTEGRLCMSARRLAPSLSCAVVRLQAEERLAHLGAAYDYVLTWDAPSDFSALLITRGYHPLYERGALSLYQPPK